MSIPGKNNHIFEKIFEKNLVNLYKMLEKHMIF